MLLQDYLFFFKQRICLHNIGLGFSANKYYGGWQLHATVWAMLASPALLQLTRSFPYHALSDTSPQLLVGWRLVGSGNCSDGQVREMTERKLWPGLFCRLFFSYVNPPVWLAAAWTEGEWEGGKPPGTTSTKPGPFPSVCKQRKTQINQPLLCWSYSSPLQQRGLLWLFWLNSQF